MSLEAKLAWLVAALVLVLVALFAVDFRIEKERRERCEAKGGQWVVTGHHYQPPGYIKSGPAMFPIGGGEIDDWGCR